MRGFILLAALVVCVGCSGAKPTVEEPVPVSKLASLQPYKRPEPYQSKAEPTVPKKVKPKATVVELPPKIVEPVKKKEIKEEQKKPNEIDTAEEERLKKIDIQLAFLPKSEQNSIIRARERIAKSPPTVDNEDYLVLKNHPEFFNRTHLRAAIFVIADGKGAASLCLSLKLSNPKQVEKFKIMLAFETEWVPIVYGLNDAANGRFKMLPDEQRALMRPYAEFLVNVKP